MHSNSFLVFGPLSSVVPVAEVSAVGRSGGALILTLETK